MGVRAPGPVTVGDITGQVMPARGQDKDGRWYWRARRGGGQQYVFTGRAFAPGMKPASAGRAERDVLELLLAIAAGVAPPSTRALSRPATSQPAMDTVGQSLDVWWTSVVRDSPDHQPSTRALYRWRVKQLARTIGHVAIEQLTERHPEAHRVARQRAGKASATIHTELCVLLLAWRWWRDIGLVSIDPPKIQHRVTAKLERPTPGRGDFRRVLALAEGRHKAILGAQGATGARIGEITGLLQRDVELAPSPRQAGILHLGRNAGARKTGARSVPIEGEVVDILREFWRPEDAEAPLFGWSRRTGIFEVQGWLRDFPWEDHGIKPFKSHGIRRMVADTLVRAGVDVAAAAAILGHSPVMMLKIYRQVTAGDREQAVRLAALGDLFNEGRGKVISIRRGRLR